MRTKTDIRHLAFLARESRPRLEFRLQSFLREPWKGVPERALSDSVKNLKDELADSPGVFQLFQVNLLGAFLLQKNQAPGRVIEWFRHSLSLSTVFEDAAWRDVLKGRWRAVPVLLTAEGAFVCWFLVGCLPGQGTWDVVPGWAVPLFDKDALKGIQEAAAASLDLESGDPRTRLVCCPLLKPTGRLRIQGKSLGLPLALGFLAALKDQAIPKDVAATGSIDQSGDVGRVGDLERKTAHAFSAGCKIFLYPEDNDPLEDRPEGREVVPVSTLKEAWMVSKLFTPERRRELNLFSSMLGKPQMFAANCENIPAEWLIWARKQAVAKHTVQSIGESGGLLNTLAVGLERCLERWDLERADAITGLFKDTDLAGAARTAPSAVLRWLTQNLALANHRGRVEEAEILVERIGPLTGQVAAVDLDLCATYYNHAFVTLHNAYRFEPELTQDLKTVLEVLKKRFDVECKAGCMVNPTLGALYGSVAQNFGFCGPVFIDQTLRHAELAGRCFGGGRFPEHKEGGLRRFNYMAYAHLDAKDLSRAGEVLLAYLEVDTLERVPDVCDDFSPWSHALAARYLAEARHPGIASRYLDKAFRMKKGWVMTSHPWELWLYNLGRMAVQLGKRREAETLFEGSLELCFAQEHGPTVHLMALLPLSALDHLGSLDRARADALGGRLREEARALNPYHFRSFVEAQDLKVFLSRLWGAPGGLFPFSYR
ncbi:MAG: S16 family serine protease [Desulfatiglandales bacterium]